MKNPSKSVCHIDTDTHEFTVNGAVVHLPSKEYKIVVALTEAKGHVRSRAQLLQTVWGYNPDEVKIDTRTVDQHIARLRTKLRKHGAGNLIQTIPNAGYRSVGMETASSKTITGKVDSIERVYGKKPGSWLRLFVPDLLPTVEKGRMMTLA